MMKVNEMHTKDIQKKNQKTPFGLGLALLISAILSPLLSLPPTQFGYFIQVSAMITCFWMVGALSFLWIYQFWKHYPRQTMRTLASPAVWGPLILALFSFGFSIFQNFPLKNWFGSPQLAEGGFTFLCCASLSFISILMFRHKKLALILLWVAMLCSATLAALTFIGYRDSPFLSMRFWEWAPFFFNDYLGFVLVGTAGIYIGIRQKLVHRKRCDVLALIFFGLLSYVSLSSTLKYGFLIGVAWIIFIYRYSIANKRWLTALAFMGLACGITSFLYFYDDLVVLVPKLYSTTLQSRNYLLKMLILGLPDASTPWHFLKTTLLGDGWNSYGDSILTQMFNLKKILLFRGENWDPNWEIFERDLIHTHSIIAECFSALGIIGVALLLIQRWCLIYAVPKSRFLLSVGILMLLQLMQLFWFQLPNTLPFSILGIAALCPNAYQPFSSVSGKLKRFSPYLRKVMPIFFALIFSSALFYGIHDFYLDRFKITDKTNLLDSLEAYLEIPPILQKFDDAMGGQRLLNYAKGLHVTVMDFIGAKSEEVDPIPLLNLAEQLANHIYFSLSPEKNHLALITALTLYSSMASDTKTKKWFYQDPNRFRQWGKMNDSLIRHIPSRADMAIPYFSALLEQEKTRLCLKQAQLLLDKQPDSPVGLWFYGAALLQDRHISIDKGIRILRRALQNGITRFMPIPESDKEQILQFEI